MKLDLVENASRDIRRIAEVYFILSNLGMVFKCIFQLLHPWSAISGELTLLQACYEALVPMDGWQPAFCSPAQAKPVVWTMSMSTTRLYSSVMEIGPLMMDLMGGHYSHWNFTAWWMNFLLSWVSHNRIARSFNSNILDLEEPWNESATNSRGKNERAELANQ